MISPDIITAKKKLEVISINIRTREEAVLMRAICSLARQKIASTDYLDRDIKMSDLPIPVNTQDLVRLAMDIDTVLKCEDKHFER